MMADGSEITSSTAVGAECSPSGFLRARMGDDGERVFPLFRGAEEIVIGRAAVSNWRLDHDGLAALHLKLAWDGVVLLAEPLDEDALTTLDGKPLARGKTLVRPQQQLTAGPVTIELEVFVTNDEITAMATLPPPRPTPPPRDEATGKVCMRPRYQPPRHLASSAEETRQTELAEALRPTADLLDRINRRNLGQLVTRVRTRFGGGARPAGARRQRRSRVLLAASLTLLASSVALCFFWPEPTAAVHTPARPAAPAPAPVAAAAATPVEPPLPPAALDAELKRAIDAYRHGRADEAAAHFARYGAQTGDPAARFMLWKLENRDARGAR